jgi:hypothetical protein
MMYRTKGKAQFECAPTLNHFAPLLCPLIHVILVWCGFCGTTTGDYLPLNFPQRLPFNVFSERKWRQPY